VGYELNAGWLVLNRTCSTEFIFCLQTENDRDSINKQCNNIKNKAKQKTVNMPLLNHVFVEIIS